MWFPSENNFDPHKGVSFVHIITQCVLGFSKASERHRFQCIIGMPYSEQPHGKVSFPPEALLGTLKPFIIRKSSLTDLPQWGWEESAEMIWVFTELKQHQEYLLLTVCLSHRWQLLPAHRITHAQGSSFAQPDGTKPRVVIKPIAHVGRVNYLGAK